MRNSILSNLHLSRLALDVGCHPLLLGKAIFTISLSHPVEEKELEAGDGKEWNAAPACILALTNNVLLKGEKNFLKPKSFYCFFGTTFYKVYTAYLVGIGSFIPDGNSVRPILMPNEFLIRLDGCTNFYNAYPELSWFRYVENPSFSISYEGPVGQTADDSFLQFLYLSTYFNLAAKA